MTFLSVRARSLLVAVLASGLTLAAAQIAPQNPAQSSQDQQDLPVIRKKVELVLVEATVRDRGGKAMKILNKDDFLVYDNGEPQEVAHFSQDQLPLAVAMVVDLSGSIQPFLYPLRYACVSALKALKAEDEVALFTFSTNVDQRVELTQDKLEVSTQLEDVAAGGGTNINDAVYHAARYLREKAPAARRVIVLVSDNVPTHANYSASAVTEAALEADAAVYGLKVPGRNPFASRMAKIGQRFVNVKNLTGDTGGEIFDVEQEGSLYLAFKALIERLKTRYTLGFYPPKGSDGRAFHTLEVKLHPSFGMKDRDYTLVSKKGYYPARSR